MTEPPAADQRTDIEDAAGPLRALRAALAEGAARIVPSLVAEGVPAFTFERPKRAEHGDYATNAALVLAPRAGGPPREVAERLGAELAVLLGDELERFEVAGPGFLNLFLSERWLRGGVASVLAAGERFGAGGAARPERVLVEFVSANPTGPMHVGHARNAAYGDSLARMLAFHGHLVSREFYVNDAGSQIAKFGESIAAVARGEDVPEGGYHGDYVIALAAQLPEAAAADAAETGRAAVELMLEATRASLDAFRVEPFDRWQSERALHEGEPSLVEHTLGILAEQGHTYTADGALWLRTTDFGDDKDRVLVRSNGEHTYFASDTAYHQDKRERGFERQIDVWGADHHGYVARTKAAYQALGGDPDELELLIMQLVHLVRSGERAQMSKRAGEFVSLDELVTEIGVDAARWYLLARSHDTTVDLDLDLAREQSNENPVYYVQYAHARIASMLDRAGAGRVAAALEEARGGEAPPGEPLHPSQRALILLLLGFPGVLEEAVMRRAPHRIAAAALELAQGFTAFYRDCRVVGAEPASSESERIALSVAAMTTIARCLDLLGVVGARAHVAKNRSKRASAAPVATGSVEAGEIGFEPRRVLRAERGRHLAATSATGPPAPARQQHEEGRGERDHRRERDEVGGGVESVVGRQAENRGAVLGDERPLDRGFVVAAADQRADECPLAVGLRRLGDLQRDFAGHAHHLAFDRRHRCGRRPGGSGRSQQGERRGRGQEPPSHVLSANRIALSTKACSISPREIATMWPLRSTMNDSGSWSVP